MELVTETVYFSSFCGYDLLDSATKHLGRGKFVARGSVISYNLVTGIAHFSIFCGHTRIKLFKNIPDGGLTPVWYIKIEL